jgi:DNA-binding transcriptional ArsR family regulator
MSRALFHPTTEQIELPRMLDCLSDPIRLAIVVKLADTQGASQELRCRDFSALGAKSNLAYHFDKLRDAGLVWTRLAGTNRYMRLRRQDLDARFPGLLDAVINSATRNAGALQLPVQDCAADLAVLLTDKLPGQA